LFAELLRPMLQKYFDVQTNVPVGDAPRAADILLLQRTGSEPTPFRGLWRHLTTWNILEFKGPTVTARARHLPLLVELGLGIFRRLNEERQRQKETLLTPEQAAFWYIARRLGKRFVSNALDQLGHLDQVEPGLWRSQILRHSVFFIDSERFASEPDSVPLHLLFKRSPERERELAHLVVEQPHYFEWYGSVLSAWHPEGWEGVKNMATKGRSGLEYDFTGIIEDIGLDKLVKNVGAKTVVEAVGPEKFMEEIGIDWLLAKLTPAQRKKIKESLK
jgi:hypothetical protein